MTNSSSITLSSDNIKRLILIKCHLCDVYKMEMSGTQYLNWNFNLTILGYLLLTYF